LYDFDPSTGIVSNCKVLDSTTMQYGAEFSPDNTKLYCEVHGYQIDQYDITAGSAAAIRATRTTVVSTSAESDLKLGPDGKIYFSEIGSTFLSCIPNPNVAGSGCGYVATAVTLAGTSTATYGMPNVFVVPAFGGTVFKRIDSTLCLPAAGITINADTTGSSYLWSTGAVTSGITITTPGIYWVRITNGCQLNIDTFNITNNLTDTVFHVYDTSFCSSAGSITINAQAGYSSYLWSTGALTPSISVSTTATVYAYSTLGCQVVIDTFHVVVDPFVQQALVSDTSYCFPGSLTLFAPAGYTANTWQDGSASTKLEVTTAGTYYVASTAYCKDRVDTFHVLPATLTFSLGPDVTVCINYMILPPVTGPDVTYKWQDGSTTSFYSAYHTGDYALTITKGGCVAYDTIRVNFFHFSQNIPDTFICKGVPISLELTATPPAGGQVLWNDGTTNPVKTVRDSGTYWVYVSKDECKILDTVHVVTGYCNCWHNVPTAFTPNNDGLNDIIRPVIEPGCTISGYQFTIFNRWGELVYTSDFQGKGWDGTYKGGPADMGVYNYSLQFFIGVHDKPVSQSGTITLVR
ncbi:MAG: gliding motility-associated C-terminal domain-containing protein, partial [Taibaiella sp.]|nr:gliding motility-associated C-terminal domain-containing protein [Taibaiella sp.]